MKEQEDSSCWSHLLNGAALAMFSSGTDQAGESKRVTIEKPAQLAQGWVDWWAHSSL